MTRRTLFASIAALFVGRKDVAPSMAWTPLPPESGNPQSCRNYPQNAKSWPILRIERYSNIPR